MVDRSGAFTTAAARVTAVEYHLRASREAPLSDQRVVVLGGTGPVGLAAAVLAARAAAQVVIMSRQRDRADRLAALCSHSFGEELTQHPLLQQMRQEQEPLTLHFEQAFQFARQLVQKDRTIQDDAGARTSRNTRFRTFSASSKPARKAEEVPCGPPTIVAIPSRFGMMRAASRARWAASRATIARVLPNDKAMGR